MAQESLTPRLAAFIASADFADLPASTADKAAAAILDTLAVLVAGGGEAPVTLLDAALDPAGQGGIASPWSGKSLSPEDAALLYGMASHILDYDDVCMLGVCHPSAPILSALLAALPQAAAQGPVSGARLQLAFCVGTEVMTRIGEGLGFRPYALGFHTTAILGTLGAAAAVAKLRGMAAQPAAHALAIAASMAAGLRKNFGSMVKPLHVGLAAQNGVRAARLAAAGITGSAEPFEADAFLQAYSGGETDIWPGGIRFGAPFSIESPGFSQKLFPCCYMLHKMIAATLELRARTPCTPEQLARAVVHMPKGGGAPLIHPRPRTGLHAKFSAPYAILASLLDGRIGLESFTDAAVMRPAIQTRLADVELVESDTAPLQGSDIDQPVTVTLTLRDGSVLTHTVEHAPGAAASPLTRAQLGAKWTDCLRHGHPALTQPQAEKFFAEGCRLAEMADVSGWLGAVLNPARTIISNPRPKETRHG
ncbi:MmgE/PrpD family protein [Acidocella sp.]|uniref:MmgE/PrpD family protein n=1 Tax=Acidocella sp. TaxID=50710 RepID=UPI002634FEFA|nr:MmgE/PrpD family protein [Acidocella sp.]